jgi:hypothetical protein
VSGATGECNRSPVASDLSTARQMHWRAKTLASGTRASTAPKYTFCFDGRQESALRNLFMNGKSCLPVLVACVLVFIAIATVMSVFWTTLFPTYPWAIQVSNRSGETLEFYTVKGEPTWLFPGTLKNLPSNQFKTMGWPRIKTVPKSCTIQWKLLTHAATQQQEVMIPPIPSNSDGWVVFELGRDGEWKSSFSHELTRYKD